MLLNVLWSPIEELDSLDFELNSHGLVRVLNRDQAIFISGDVRVVKPVDVAVHQLDLAQDSASITTSRNVRIIRMQSVQWPFLDPQWHSASWLATWYLVWMRRSLLAYTPKFAHISLVSLQSVRLWDCLASSSAWRVYAGKVVSLKGRPLSRRVW